MTGRSLRLIASVAFVLAGCQTTSTSPSADAGPTYTIATGGERGLYFPIGGAICQTAADAFQCRAKATRGSVDNLGLLRRGSVDFAIARSEWAHRANVGSSRFRDAGPDPKLRSVFSLYADTFSLLVRADSDIERIADLKGRRVNVGPSGSTDRTVFGRVLESSGLTEADLTSLGELKSAERARALCDGLTDAIFYTVAHPSGWITRAADLCAVRFISIVGTAADTFLKRLPFYQKAVVPGGLYTGAPRDVPTIGLGTVLMASADTPDAVVYALVKSVFDDLDAFKRRHPALALLEAQGMTTDSLSVPLHPGAAAYYRDAGFL